MQMLGWLTHERRKLRAGICLAFVLAQISDGVLTYIGILKMGTHVEGNPLLAWYMTAMGGALTIVGAKVFALACGAVLHLQAQHRAIAALTLLYFSAAVWPWALVLWLH
jgi:arginine exporter protein ArgO